MALAMQQKQLQASEAGEGGEKEEWKDPPAGVAPCRSLRTHALCDKCGYKLSGSDIYAR